MTRQQKKRKIKTQEGNSKGHKQIVIRKRRNGNRLGGFRPDIYIKVEGRSIITYKVAYRHKI